MGVSKPGAEGNNAFPANFFYRDNYLLIGNQQELTQIIEKWEQENIKGENAKVDRHAPKGRSERSNPFFELAKGSSEDINRRHQTLYVA